MNYWMIALLIVVGVYVWDAEGKKEELGAASVKIDTLNGLVSQWTAAAKGCSDSVEKAKNEADRRTRNAAIALKQAQATVGATEAEIARLRSSKPSSAECPAGQAVSRVREGLK